MNFFETEHSYLKLGRMAQSHSCKWCSFSSKARLDLIKHSFGAHSMESTFILRCGIGGCFYQFRSGKTFFSFKIHADRKHPNWRQKVNNSTEMQSESVLDNVDGSQQEEPQVSEPEFPTIEPHRVEQNSPADIAPSYNPPSAKHTAALFLLTLHEKYKLPQCAVNFAVGSVNSIVESVCISSTNSFAYEDPFAGLQTEHQQSRYFREEFGLVVS